MGLKKITQNEAIEKAAAGAEVYILRRITDKTTIGELSNALAFAEAVEAPKADPEPEGVAEQAEAPAMKRKRGRPASLDKDKVMALFKAGWAVETIAKEMDAPIAKVRAITMQEDL